MPWRILTLLLLVLAAWPAAARTASARIDAIDAAGIELRDVRVRLYWPAQASQGELRIEAARIHAPALGYRFAGVRWECPLVRPGSGAWRCEGPLRAGDGSPVRLAVDLSPATTDAVLSGGGARLALHRDAARPDATQLQLTRVPLVWAQALLASAWQEGRLSAGSMAGTIDLHTPTGRPVQVVGALVLAGLGLESDAGTIALGDLDGTARFDLRLPQDGGLLLSLDGAIDRGEALFGNAYLALDGAPVAFGVDAWRRADGGWDARRIEWRDAAGLDARGSAVLDAQGALRALDLSLDAGMLSVLPERYLSGWLGLAGLSGLALEGAATARLQVDARGLEALDLRLRDVGIADPRGRFRIDGLEGDLRHAATGALDSELRWRSGALYELQFGAVRLPLHSSSGTLHLREAAEVEMLGGRVRLDGFSLTPPRGHEGLRVGFGLALDALEVGQLASAFGWPEFRGTLGGRIPSARYADERLAFEGGLSVHVFDGRIDVGALSMERPFGVAPTLSADLSLHDLDLMDITGAFDFGSISGRLHGRIDGLRLVDWTATAFDAELHTEPRRGVRQRISQRAVQDISSVGDASFVSSLQGRLIGLFDDFGYRRIGIGCRLANQVCAMSGLHSAGNGFTIVEGAGIPRLRVVGFNRDVDWPTLLERLAAAATGDVAPVVD